MVVVAAPIAVAASAGLGMLAGVAMANRSRQRDAGSSSASAAASALRWGAPPTAPRCATCGGTGREECRLCTRWSDGDCSGCRACAGTGRTPCRSCGGSGTGRRAPFRVSSAPPRPHLKA